MSRYYFASKLLVECASGFHPGASSFSIYMNDISRCSVILSIILFADDTNLFLSYKNLDTLAKTMNHELRKIATWLQSANKLSLNIKKTRFIIFKSRGKNLIKMSQLKSMDTLLSKQRILNFWAYI